MIGNERKTYRQHDHASAEEKSQQRTRFAQSAIRSRLEVLCGESIRLVITHSRSSNRHDGNASPENETGSDNLTDSHGGSGKDSTKDDDNATTEHPDLATCQSLLSAIRRLASVDSRRPPAVSVRDDGREGRACDSATVVTHVSRIPRSCCGEGDCELTRCIET